MQFLLVFSVLFHCLSFTCCFEWASLTRWQEWKRQHKRDFGFSHDGKRRRIWAQNFKLIINHNKVYLSGCSNFTMTMNKFGAAALNEYIGILDARLKPSSLKVPRLSPAPSALDYRALGLVTPVKDQGTCSSSWAFSVIGAIEAQVAKSTGILVSLSVQNLVDCSTNISYGCNGAWMVGAYNYIQRHGINSEASYPYVAKDDQACSHDPDKNVIEIRGHGQLPPGDEETLKKALASFGPIAVTVDASNISFMFYKAGIYDDPQCSASKVTHAVLLVGYGSESGVDYWIIKNSWGTGWGEKGYMRMLRNGSNFCGIATYALYPLL